MIVRNLLTNITPVASFALGDKNNQPKKVSITKLVIEILIFIAVTISNLIFFNGFWMTILKISLTFISLGLLDFISDLLIKYICVNSEKKRKEIYDIKIQKINEENEAIRKANLGITAETEKFFDNSILLFNEFKYVFDSFKPNLNLESKNEKRVIDKFEEFLKELEELNGKLSKDNIDSTYITTLYDVHLPKLLEYSKRFSASIISGILTQKQIIEFSNLIEVFRTKIDNHAEYLQNKEEDDFLIKMQALNEDIIPEYDGSEEENHE